MRICVLGVEGAGTAPLQQASRWGNVNEDKAMLSSCSGTQEQHRSDGHDMRIQIRAAVPPGLALTVASGWGQRLLHPGFPRLPASVFRVLINNILHRLHFCPQLPPVASPYRCYVSTRPRRTLQQSRGPQGLLDTPTNTRRRWGDACLGVRTSVPRGQRGG